MTHAGVRGVFITISDDTADARAYAESHGINLVNGNRLAKLVAAIPTAEDALSPGTPEPTV